MTTSHSNRGNRFIVLAVIPGMIQMLGATAGFAQWTPTPNDTLVSTRILPGNQVKFSVYAPEAKQVVLGGTDIPDMGWTGKPMTRTESGVWEVLVGSVEPGAYRYTFVVDGVSMVDPRNPLTSQSNMNSWSLLYIPGAGFMDTKVVPHGAVAEVTYFSQSLKCFRRMHVYTPPGYETGKEKYPIFYLLHGAWDCDDSWTTVGRAGFILDNLIAEKKARPMVVVMPAGHTGPFPPPASAVSPAQRPKDLFLDDFVNDIMPYAETHYRILSDREHRAMAGLSMGGAQTLNVGIPHLGKFAYLGVFSSGVFGLSGNSGPFANPNEPPWEEMNKEFLSDAGLKIGLKIVWFATGKDDFLISTSRATVDLLKKYNFDVIHKETTGAHTWTNWRLYLHEFTQLLFQEKP